MVRNISQRQAVGTTATWIGRFKVSELQSLVLLAIGNVEVGHSGVSIGSGIPISAGSALSISHLDFRKDDKPVQESWIDLYAVATVATTVHIYGFAR